MSKPSHGTLGKTKQVTYRMPLELYEKLLKISESMFQPIPVVLRAAAAEYARNHRPVRHKNTGLALKWPEDVAQVRKDGSIDASPCDMDHAAMEAEVRAKGTTGQCECGMEFGTKHTESVPGYVNAGDTLVTPSEDKS